MSGKTRWCEGCGREVERLHRRWRGKGYCSSCYARLFERRACPSCGQAARLPKNHPGAVCRRCEWERPCVRCGRERFRPGKMTPYGPACSSCAKYFAEPYTCPLCGKETRYTALADAGEGETIRACPRCAWGKEMGACQECRRHRKLAKAADGRLLCRKCRNEGSIPCPRCGAAMPAGRGNCCENCYWQDLLGRRAALNAKAMGSTPIREGFIEFSKWLAARRGHRAAATLLSRYVTFFLDMDKTWGDFPDYSSLLERFSAEGLRRVRNVIGWLEASGRIVVDRQARENDSERRRIESITKSVPEGTAAREIMEQYRARMMERIASGRTSLKSARLALRPAADLLARTMARGKDALPSQEDVDRYLLEKPGQSAALSGFLSFLGEMEGLRLVPRVDPKAAFRNRKKCLERRLRQLSGVSDRDWKWTVQWVMTCLEYFHGIKVRKRDVACMAIEQDAAGWWIRHQENEYWIPDADAS